MKLNRDFELIMSRSVKGADMVALVKRLLPNIGYLRCPSVVVVALKGSYYVVKSRWNLIGESVPLCENPVDPYSLDFKEHTIKQIRSVCNPATNFFVPNEIVGSCILLNL